MGCQGPGRGAEEESLGAALACQKRSYPSCEVTGDMALLRHQAWHCPSPPDQSCLKASAWKCCLTLRLAVVPGDQTEISYFALTEPLMPSFPVTTCGKGEERRGRPDSGMGGRPRIHKVV